MFLIFLNFSRGFCSMHLTPKSLFYVCSLLIFLSIFILEITKNRWTRRCSSLRSHSLIGWMDKHFSGLTDWLEERQIETVQPRLIYDRTSIKKCIFGQSVPGVDYTNRKDLIWTVLLDVTKFSPSSRSVMPRSLIYSFWCNDAFIEIKSTKMW